MAEFATTDADTIREAIANAITSIVPRHSARRDERYVRIKDGEVPGGSALRSFDVDLGPEREVPAAQFAGAWHGGGVVYGSDVEIRVSYPLHTKLAARFAGADGQDIAALLVDLHTTVTGMFALSADGPGPVLEGPELEGDGGRHVAVFSCFVTFFVSDEVTTD